MRIQNWILAITFAALSLTPLARAQATAAAAPAQQLQWTAIDLDAEHFKGMRDLAVNALGLHPLVDQPNFAVFAAPNGSLFEIYGPGSPDYAWRHGQGGLSVGFLTADIGAALKDIQKSGGALVGDLKIFPHAGLDGGDYAFQLFKAPDNRVYAIAQARNYHAK